ncbi:hypothetical protein QEG98_11285 [Myxococcus sp. MxC21-1]|uniref:hypothetical protein n=1 Tax=Myxococcus sp. MxC21-1 TaxID=3041439 RepID=UPI00292D705F|nr:hypothetical protein [Myxococcus sp. MxC21-1]WNZ64198.1 hypothetical protein QEG98_11285 [Myxococcus sp. MxC21-1]
MRLGVLLVRWVSPRSLGIPSQTARDELSAQLQRTLTERDEERAREAGRASNQQ